MGLAIPLQGPAGLFAPSCEAAAELAAAQLNDEGGICGRQVSLETIEAGDSPARAAGRVHRAIAEGRIDALTGWHLSSVCQGLAQVAKGRIPYVYPVLYEGGGLGEGAICSGEVPERQIRPALEWLRQRMGFKRWCIVGNDYIWPRASAQHVREFCHDLELTVTDQIFVRYGTTHFSRVVERVERSGADGVLMLLVGQDAVLFNREFAGRGLSATMARFSPLMEETMLLASGPDATDNLYAAAGYFTSLMTGGAMDLMGSYVRRYGAQAPRLNNMAEACHEGILFLRSLHTAARSCDVGKLMAKTERVGFDGARGAVSMQGGVCLQPVHLARADGVDFDILETIIG
ncbi:substrate-binding domain-containing protein [Naumannella sp. ID2617S]|nr:substrate-binding domain-containing protein [Naumannella sp. ID2617S]